MRVHASSPAGEAKFWLEPVSALAAHTRLAKRELLHMQSLVEERHAEIVRSWRRHFGRR